MKKESVAKLICNIIVTIIFFISFCFLIIGIFEENDLSKSYEEYGLLISLVTGYSSFIYNNSNNMFFFVNKIRVYFSRETVHWEITYRTVDISLEDIQKVERELIRVLGEDGKVVKNKKNEESIAIEFENDKGISSQFDLRWNIDTQGKYSLSIIFKSQTAHREVLKQWTFYRTVSDEIFKPIGQQINHQKKPYEEKSYYTVSLKMDKNPFYLLAIKTYDKPRDIKFNLTFKADGVKFQTSNNKIVITTQDKNKVDTILKDYVMLGKVS